MAVNFRYSEIENFYRITAALIRFEPNVVGFQIAMDNSLLMRFVDGGRYLFDDVERPTYGQAFFFVKNFAERTAIEIFHYEVRDLAVFGMRKTEIRDINDVRVPKPSGGTCLTAKTFDEFGPL